MKSGASIVVALSLSFAAGLLVGGTKQKESLPVVQPAQAVDAAFRDGFYLAKLDAAEGRKPHPAIGRWNTTEDRASFFAGYQKGYRASAETVGSRIEGPSVAELIAAGYRDGMRDGRRHRVASQPFQADQTPNYRQAGAVYLGASPEPDQYQYFYREAYVNGYRHAFFVKPEERVVETIQ